MKKTFIAVALLIGISILSGCSVPFGDKEADTPTGNNGANTPAATSTSDNPEDWGYVYRVVGDERKGFKIYADYSENMHKYPKGIDFKTDKEAMEYVFKEGGGGYLD